MFSSPTHGLFLSIVASLMACGTSSTPKMGAGGDSGAAGGGRGGESGVAGQSGAGGDGGQGGCTSNDECLESEMCASGPFAPILPSDPVWTCGGPGVCVPTPGLCSGFSFEVCLCNGDTYASCGDLPRVRPAALGACNCMSNDDCLEDELCNGFTCDGPGHCDPIPAECGAAEDSVRGCDAQDYPSLCAANAARVRVPVPDGAQGFAAP